MKFKSSKELAKCRQIMLDEMKKHGIQCDLKHPKTIQEKLAWLNMYDNNPLKSMCADKILIHDYCKQKLGKDICIPLIETYDRPEDIDFGVLPQKFVLKCNHGSAMNIIVKDKSQLNINDTKNTLRYWLNVDYTFLHGFEAHYHDIKHRILAEEYKENSIGELYDFKFWCFNGTPKLWTVNSGLGHGPIMYFDMDQKPVNLYGLEEDLSQFPMPNNFQEMTQYARTLSEPFKFVRVDFYEIDGQTFLGEMTFTPGAMHFKYATRELDIKVGNMLKI